MDITHQSDSALMVREIDLAAAFEFARSDSDWVMKYVTHGAITLVPVAGALVYFGWGRRIYQRVREGRGHEGLPALDFGGELSDGIAPFVALLNIFAIVMPLMMVGWGALFALGIGASILGDSGGGAVLGLVGMLGMLAFYAMMFVVMIGVQVISPELTRRGYNGEMTPLLSFGRSIRAIRAQPKMYMMTFIGILLGNMIGSLGGLLCGVGVIFTAPFGHAMAAHVLAQWDSVVSQID
ncbi:MAG: hypothetical protein ACI8S6_005319 [Myxococcota bacterium]|jgi:hypothetical protein